MKLNSLDFFHLFKSIILSSWLRFFSCWLFPHQRVWFTMEFFHFSLNGRLFCVLCTDRFGNFYLWFRGFLSFLRRKLLVQDVTIYAAIWWSYLFSINFKFGWRSKNITLPFGVISSNGFMKSTIFRICRNVGSEYVRLSKGTLLPLLFLTNRRTLFWNVKDTRCFIWFLSRSWSLLRLCLFRLGSEGERSLGWVCHSHCFLLQILSLGVVTNEVIPGLLIHFGSCVWHSFKLSPNILLINFILK